MIILSDDWVYHIFKTNIQIILISKNTNYSYYASNKSKNNK
jgi:hypothetical protein